MKAAIKGVLGPQLRAEGFKGSGSRWQVMSDVGDTAIVNVQRSQFGDKGHVKFIINVAVVTEPWLAWLFRGKVLPRHPKEYQGIWSDRVRPSGTSFPDGPEVWWEVRTVAEAEAAIADAAMQLKLVGLPRLRAMLQRDALLAALEEEGVTRNQHQIIVMLAAQGPSEKLDHMMNGLPSDSELRAWVRSRPSGWVGTPP